MDLPFDNIPLAPLYKTIVRWVKNYRSRYSTECKTVRL